MSEGTQELFVEWRTDILHMQSQKSRGDRAHVDDYAAS